LMPLRDTFPSFALHQGKPTQKFISQDTCALLIIFKRFIASSSLQLQVFNQSAFED
jgi:hypothetical protein